MLRPIVWPVLKGAYRAVRDDLTVDPILFLVGFMVFAGALIAAAEGIAYLLGAPMGR